MNTGKSAPKPENAKWWHSLTTMDTRLYVVYGAGIAASFSALFELVVDYGGWLKPFGIAMPVIVDLYWMTALQVALDSSRSNRQRWQSAVHAFFAISISITGNILYHELDTGTWHMSKSAHGNLVAVLACIPVVLTGTLTHLVLLARNQPGAHGTEVPDPVPAPAAREPGTVGTVPAEPPAGSRPAPGPVPGTAAPEAGTAPGPVPAPPADEIAAADRKPRPSRDVTETGDLRMLRDTVVQELADRPRPAVEDVTERVARAEKFLAEFRARTGVRMSNKELARALGVRPATVAEVRASVTEPGGEDSETEEGEGAA